MRTTFLQQLGDAKAKLVSYYSEKIGGFNALGQEYMVPAFRWKEDLLIKGSNLTVQNTNISKIFNFYFLVNRKF